MVLIHWTKIDLIEFTLNVIFQGHKGINLFICSHFDTYCPFIPRLCGKFLIYFVMYSFPRMILMKCEETDYIKLL